MPRQARKLSRTGVYHVMLRGINRQDIFEDDEDYRQMTGCLRSLTERYDDMITRTVPMISYTVCNSRAKPWRVFRILLIQLSLGLLIP